MPGNLVLVLDIGTTLHIGDDIDIQIKEVRATGAMLVIRAPREVPILRSDAKVKESRHGSEN